MYRHFVLVNLTVLLIGFAHGLNEESAREQPCFNISNTVPLDLKWVGSIKTLYYPLMSRLELYRIAADLLEEDMKVIPESSLYYDSCISWKFNSDGTITSRGFKNRTRIYKTNVLAPNFQKFEFAPIQGKGYSGTVYTTLTDNSTFLFTPFCTDDGEMAWGLGSVYPTLPKETLEEVKEHAVKLGFKKEYFSELRYTDCDMEGGEEGNEDKMEVVEEMIGEAITEIYQTTTLSTNTI